MRHQHDNTTSSEIKVTTHSLETTINTPIITPPELLKSQSEVKFGAKDNKYTPLNTNKDPIYITTHKQHTPTYNVTIKHTTNRSYNL